jgi:hypothetical protein
VRFRQILLGILANILGHTQSHGTIPKWYARNPRRGAKADGQEVRNLRTVRRAYNSLVDACDW